FRGALPVNSPQSHIPTQGRTHAVDLIRGEQHWGIKYYPNKIAHLVGEISSLLQPHERPETQRIQHEHEHPCEYTPPESHARSFAFVGHAHGPLLTILANHSCPCRS